MRYVPIKKIKINLDFGAKQFEVGHLATHSGKVYFEYQKAFLDQKLEISPIRLPLIPGVKTFDPFLFEGLPGVFNDSLPDGWGRLLLERSIRSKGISPEQLTPLDRLAHVGNTGIGALTFEPCIEEQNTSTEINLDLLALHSLEVLNGEADSVLQELLSLNGSSAGARPKAMIGVDTNFKSIVHGVHSLPEGYEPWIVKFPNSTDGNDAGAIEYVYSIIAKNAGLTMPETHLFSSKTSPGYFSTKRFDRKDKKRLHVHTACGLLHSDFRTPALDYEDLLALTEILTKDIREIEKMFRLAVFNVLSYNRDDHSKNFSFLMNEQGEWKLSPAYDLTFSSGPNGEQSTMVLGEGKSPTLEHLKKLGEKSKLDQALILEIIQQTRESINSWEELAKQYDVKSHNVKRIKNTLERFN